MLFHALVELKFAWLFADKQSCIMQALQLGLASLRCVEDIAQLETALHFLIRRAAAIQTAKAAAEHVASLEALKKAMPDSDGNTSGDDTLTEAIADAKGHLGNSRGSKGPAQDGAHSTDEDSDVESQQGDEADLAVTASSQLFTASIEKRMPSLAHKV